jgi:4-hydroxybutyryl-CoA dehydratase/vinylacetyl-CoA-Delta-isomerase
MHKQSVIRFPYEISRLVRDVAGGLMVTMPSEADFNSEGAARWLEKYPGTNPGAPP